MRTIEYATAFKKDYKRVKATPRHAKDADLLLSSMLKQLVIDSPLPAANRDHDLTANWRGYREAMSSPTSS